MVANSLFKIIKCILYWYSDKYGSIAHLNGDDSDYLGRLLAYILSACWLLATVRDKDLLLMIKKTCCCWRRENLLLFCTRPAIIGSNEGHSTESSESCFARGPINQPHCNRHLHSGIGFPAGVKDLFHEMKCLTCLELFRTWLLCFDHYYYSTLFWILFV